MKYEAESPDEAALVVAAKKFGFFFCKRTSTTITVREDLPEGSRMVDYELLNILEFNSTRKRMSVVIRDPEGKLLLYCKVRAGSGGGAAAPPVCTVQGPAACRHACHLPAPVMLTPCRTCTCPCCTAGALC
jgi:hypothetical protein